MRKICLSPYTPVSAVEKQVQQLKEKYKFSPQPIETSISAIRSQRSCARVSEYSDTTLSPGGFTV